MKQKTKKASRLARTALAGAIALAASSAVIASPAFDFHWRLNGLTGASQDVPGDTEDGNAEIPAPGDNNAGEGDGITKPHDIKFSGGGDKVSGNVGGSGNVTVVDNATGETIGSGSANSEGEFTVALDPPVTGGDEVTVIATDGSGSDSASDSVVVIVPDHVGPLDDSAWVAYAQRNGLSYHSQWEEVAWSANRQEYYKKTFPQIPSEPFPNRNPEGSLSFICCQLPDSGVHTLTHVDGLSSLETVGGSLSFTFSSSLRDISGLANLRRVENNLTFFRTKVTSLAPLQNLEFVGGRLGLTQIPLSNLNGLEGLKEVGELRAYIDDNNPSYGAIINNIDGLKNLERAGYIGLQGTSIRHVDALSNLTEITMPNEGYKGIDLSDNQYLASIEGLRNLTHVIGAIKLINVPNIVDLSPLNNIAYMEPNRLHIDKSFSSRGSRVGYKRISPDAWLCQPENSDVFFVPSNPRAVRNYATQADVCG